MSTKSKNTLHSFLFHLRTPLASIRSLAALVDKTADLQFPLEAGEWLTKWLPKVNIWWESTIELTELYSTPEVDDHDWKALIQQLMFRLEGVEAAVDEAKKIRCTDKDMPGYVFHKVISSIENINDEYKAMEQLLPKLD